MSHCYIAAISVAELENTEYLACNKIVDGWKNIEIGSGTQACWVVLMITFVKGLTIDFGR